MTLAQVQRDVARLAGKVAQLQRRNTALALSQALRIKRMVIDIGPVAVGTVDHDVVWPVPFADESYWVGVEVVSGLAGVGTLHAQLKVASRTNAGCQVTVVSSAVVAVAFLDVLAVRP